MASSSSATVRLVDAVVVGDHLLGEAHVGLVERPRRLLDRIGDEVGDLDEPVLHLAQFLLEHLTHERNPCLLGPARGTRATGSIRPRVIFPAPGEQQVPGP